MQVVHKTHPTKSRRMCSVPMCSTYCSPGISIHYFPKDPKVCKKWKDVLKIGKPISKFMCVCSEHFVKEDFMPVTADTIVKRLKKGVVPSQKLPLRPHDQPKTHIKRSDRKWLKRGNSGISNATEFNDGNINFCLNNGIPQVVTETTSSFSLQENVKTIATVSFCEDRATQTNLFQLPQILNNDEKLRYFTGIDSSTLNIYVKCVENTAMVNNVSIEDAETNLILVMCKIKTNMTFVCLGVLFGISTPTCSRHFYKYVSLLAASLKSAILWPSKEQTQKNLPNCFEKFKATRVVLDATEIKLQKLKCLKCRILSYSNYKCNHTMKFLIGITPSGLISFVSKGYGGRSSDKAIFCNENLITKFDPFDAIMVDKGILIEKECSEYFITLIRPPFLKQKKQLSKEDATITADIARARVHVERAIQRMKTFSILNEQIDWYLIPYIEDIVTVIAATVNMSSPILADNRF